MCECAECDGKVFMSQSGAFKHELLNPKLDTSTDDENDMPDLLDSSDDENDMPDSSDDDLANDMPEMQGPSDREHNGEGDASDIDFSDDEFEETAANEILCRQILELVATKQMTQRGCDLLLQVWKQYNEKEEADPASMPTSFYMVKKMADARGSLVHDPEDSSRLVDLCPEDHVAYHAL